MHRSGIAGNGEESFALSQCTQNLLQRGALFIMPYIDEFPIDGVFAHHRNLRSMAPSLDPTNVSRDPYLYFTQLANGRE